MTYTTHRTRILSLLLAAGLLAGCGGGDGDGQSTMVAAEPELESSVEARDAALNCTAFENPDKPPVLLVHGTTTTGTEQFTVFYTPQLVERGFDVCIVTYPDRGLIDQQISAEYTVHALRNIHAETGRKVAMIGHSQGATMPRWALKHWASAREAVADFVLIAGPNHGTQVAIPATIGETLLDTLGLSSLPIGTAPEAFYQFTPDSDFVAVLNADDETPGEVDYTNLYTLFDELVQPAAPVPTAALDFGKDNPKVANILLQDVCPGHLAEHFSIGTTDTLAFALALDAISKPGPADPERAGGAAELCGLVPIDLQTLVMPQRAQDLLSIVATTLQGGPPDPHLATGEPPLKPYAQDDLPAASDGE
ncbi:MAG: esterase/lipase family protein [Algiphilus sp.]